MDRDIVVVGSVNADLLVEVEPTPAPWRDPARRATSVLRRRQGRQPGGGRGSARRADVAMVGAVGRDAVRRGSAERARGARRSTSSSVAVVEGATGLAVVTVADDGENTHRRHPRRERLRSRPTTVATATSTIQRALVCVLQAEIPLDAVRRAARPRRPRGPSGRAERRASVHAAGRDAPAGRPARRQRARGGDPARAVTSDDLPRPRLPGRLARTSASDPSCSPSAPPGRRARRPPRVVVAGQPSRGARPDRRRRRLRRRARRRARAR